MKRFGMAVAVIVVATLILGLVVFLASFSIVQEGHIGVKYQMGRIIADDLQPGWNWKAPFVQRIQQIDIREQLYETVETVYTRDTQTVESMYIKLSYVYDPARLSHLIRTVGMNNIEGSLIVQRVSSILENATGQYRAEDLVQSRAQLERRVSDELAEELYPYGIIVRRFAIEDINFEDQFEQVIRLKVEAEQEALRAQNETVRITEVGRQNIVTAEAAAEAERIRVAQEAANRVIRAQSEADAERLLAEAEAYGMELIQTQLMRGGQAYIDYIRWSNWNGQLPHIMGGDANLILDTRPDAPIAPAPIPALSDD